MIKIDVLKDGIDKTLEILRPHFPDPKIERIGRTSITVDFPASPMLLLKFSKIYYIVKDRFANPWVIESSDAIDAVVEMYDELQTKRNNEIALFAQTSRSLLDKRKDNVRLRRQLAENKRLISKLSTNSFSLDIVLDLLASMHQGICPGSFAHWDIEKDAFDYGKQSTLDSSDFIDLAYSKACDLGIEKEFCKYMDSLPTMIEKDWMEGYERRQRLKESKIGKDIMLDEEARKNSPHYVEDIAKTVVEHSIENPVMNITIEIFSSPESPTYYKALIANDFTITGQGLFVKFPKGLCILYSMIYESNEVAIPKTLELINDPSVNPIGDLICGVAKDFWKVINEARGHGWTVNFHVVEEPKVLPSSQRAWVDSQYLGELTEEVAPIQTEAPDFELHTITLKVVPYYNDKLGLQVTKNVTFNETGLIDTSDFLIFDIPKDLSIDALISKINYQHGDFNKVTDLTDSERKCLRYSRIWDGISRMRQNYKALTFVLAEPDPEPSIAEQEVMQNEVNEAREIVHVYVRVRKYKTVQSLELVQTIYDEVLEAGEDIVHSIPFNVDIHEFVKELNQRNCLAPRVGVFQPGSVSPNFTSHAQEVYRDGKTVQLIIGVPTE